MSGYISRSKLINDVENLKDCYNGFSDTYDKACIIGLIAEQPSVEQKQRWIPVTERLPQKVGTYLVFVANVFQKSMAATTTALWEGQNFIVGDFVTVTHWMPLPQPPKDGES